MGKMEPKGLPTTQQEYGPRYTVRMFLLKRWLKILPLRKETLDIGCGRGLLGLELKKLNFKLTLIDREPKMVKISKILFNQHNYEADFLVVDLFQYFPTKKYDLILCTEFLEHVDDVKALNHIYVNLLKKGGYLIVSVPTFGKISERESPDEYGHLRYYNKKLLTHRLEQVKFKVKEVKSYGGGLLGIYFYYLHKRIKREKSVEKGTVIERERVFNLYKLLFPIIKSIFLLDHLIGGGSFHHIGIVGVAQK